MTGPALDLSRIRAALERLDALVVNHPELADRGEALERDLEELMAEDEVTKGGVPVKVPVELLERADALISAVRADPDLSAMMGRVSRAAVVRVALLKGLNELEKQAVKRGKGA